VNRTERGAEVDIVETLKMARFAIEATLACLNSWNGGRGGPANTDRAMQLIDAALAKYGDQPC
jgi:hypothetical protein